MSRPCQESGITQPVTDFLQQQIASMLKKNFYFLPALAGVVLLFLSIEYPSYWGEIQMIALSLGVFTGVFWGAWKERTKRRFGLAMFLLVVVHSLILICLRHWFPFNMWFLVPFAVVEVAFLALIAFKVMGL